MISDTYSCNSDDKNIPLLNYREREKRKFRSKSENSLNIEKLMFMCQDCFCDDNGDTLSLL